MSDLWAEKRAAKREAAAPLAVRMRPRTLEEFAGQEHFLGPGELLERMLRADRLTSMIFSGPPGTGKTTLAQVIANHTQRHFEQANAAMIGVKEIRAIIEAATARLEDSGRRTILFLDEIHRFARNQQDVLLNDVESGVITLIGATTENPFFAVNSALVSRSTVFQFEPLQVEQVTAVVQRAIADVERGYGRLNLQVADDAIAHWARVSDGDARRALTALELAVESVREGSEARRHEGTKGRDDETKRHRDTVENKTSGGALTPALSRGEREKEPAAERRATQAIVVDLKTAEESIQAKALVYDSTGDAHYDLTSAFIKSMRGSDPDAAVYWLARMLEAGEDPRFIARRIAILASEDIGNADPQAIVVAAAAWEVTERVGRPECQLTLAQAAIYMALAPKSNASAKAIWTASEEVKTGRTIPVPRAFRDAHYKSAKRLGHGEGYKYAHDSPTGYVEQDYLGVERTYYEPTDRGYEGELGRRLEAIREAIRSQRSEVGRRSVSGE